ncbi:MAG: DUF5615 family PIN-like protein [Thermoguttaceae bacterium]|jgi:hypothetical protein|nr:DUF5615 family PIN-like protein [Thermoguttaceae bacterium]
MKVRFQADADLNELLIKATLRREPSIDFQTSRAAGLAGLTDREVLELAAKSGRLLATHDRKTMPNHFGEFIATETSAGVLIIPQTMPLSQVVDDLILIWTASEAEEWINRIYALPL